VVKHGTLILTTDAAEITEKTATVCHHPRESDLLLKRNRDIKAKEITTRQHSPLSRWKRQKTRKICKLMLLNGFKK